MVTATIYYLVVSAVYTLQAHVHYALMQWALGSDFLVGRQKDLLNF